MASVAPPAPATTFNGVWLAPLRWPLALFAGAACELVSSLWMAGAGGLVMLVGGYVLLLAFAARNVAVLGSVLVIAGLLANLTVICLNGGMPVSGADPASGFGPRHHPVGPGDHLTAMADVISVPALGEVFSPGDLVLGAGVTTMIAATLAGGRRPLPRRRLLGRIRRGRAVARR